MSKGQEYLVVDSINVSREDWDAEARAVTSRSAMDAVRSFAIEDHGEADGEWEDAEFAVRGAGDRRWRLVRVRAETTVNFTFREGQCVD